MDSTSDPKPSGGGARTFLEHWLYRLRGSTKTILDATRDSIYIRSLNEATGTQVGPEQVSYAFSFPVTLQASDQIGLELHGEFIQLPNATVTVLSATSGLQVNSREIALV